MTTTTRGHVEAARHDHDDEEHAVAAKHDHDDEAHAEAGHDDHHHGAFDPHAWQSLGNAVAYVDIITAALAQADPVTATDFHQNRAACVAEIEALDAEIRERGIRAVFIENNGDPRLLRQIADETGAVIGGTLYPGALSGPDGPAATYLDMMPHSATTLAQALIP